jgi:hypothetical protein
MGLLALCEFRTLFLAFNLSRRKKLVGRIEANPAKSTKSMTHSLGLSAIKI